jgi:hypothetical protein
VSSTSMKGPGRAREARRCAPPESARRDAAAEASWPRVGALQDGARRAAEEEAEASGARRAGVATRFGARRPRGAWAPLLSRLRLRLDGRPLRDGRPDARSRRAGSGSARARGGTRSLPVALAQRDGAARPARAPWPVAVPVRAPREARSARPSAARRPPRSPAWQALPPSWRRPS